MMENGFNQFWKQTLQILILYGNYSPSIQIFSQDWVSNLWSKVLEMSFKDILSPVLVG